MSEPLFACDYSWTADWVRGHVDKRKFKGSLLSRLPYRDDGMEVDDIIRGKVVCGWTVTTQGSGDEFCEPGTVQYLLEEEPPLGSTYEGFPIVEGPSPCTFLKVNLNVH